MNRTTILATGAIATLAAGTIVATGAANAAGTTHTLKLVGSTVQQTQLGKSHEVETDLLRKPASSSTVPIGSKTPPKGAKQGYAIESCSFGAQNDVCSLSIALKAGILYGHVTFPITTGDSSTAKGKITGGLGGYSGATGHIKIVTGPKQGAYTITYSR
jgi:hypothetical protein